MENDKQAGRIEGLLGDLGKKIDQLMEKMRHQSGETREDVNEWVEDLKGARDKVDEEFKRFRERVQEERSSDRWKEVEIRLENSANELKKALEALIKKKSDD